MPTQVDMLGGVSLVYMWSQEIGSVWVYKEFELVWCFLQNHMLVANETLISEKAPWKWCRQVVWVVFIHIVKKMSQEHFHAALAVHFIDTIASCYVFTRSTQQWYLFEWLYLVTSIRVKQVYLLISVCVVSTFHSYLVLMTTREILLR